MGALLEIARLAAKAANDEISKGQPVARIATVAVANL